MFFRYASLLSQYSAVSFGDPLFGCFVVLPLTQRHDIKFRSAVWDEHIGVLRALAIPLDQVTYHWCLVLLHGRLICHVTLFGSFIEAVHTVSCCEFRNYTQRANLHFGGADSWEKERTCRENKAGAPNVNF